MNEKPKVLTFTEGEAQAARQPHRRLYVAEDETTLSLDEIYRRHLRFVWRNLSGLGVPETSLEDAAHDVFMTLHRKLDTFDGSSAVTTWIYGVTRRVAANYRRAHAKSIERRGVGPSPTIPPGPDAHVGRSEARELVAAFLETLDPDASQVFRLREIEGLRVPEIAEALAVNVNTVYTRSRAARRRFREYLERRLGSGKGERSA